MTMIHAPYRLRFQGTRKLIPAATLKQAKDDASYWLGFGQKLVRIEKRMPSGQYVEILAKRKRRR